ncbi:hypothetical protein PFY12_02290 [Chryseobacterium camelliae]|uniref:Uncharacterized protein n=1 Tax=Chryseobacterium camelliae TaxID=1265445 RepID=A0ABY7QMP7_9FLAO|nr:hypothetical protein [Chryseobacterium camelliae]WBV60961.1 hypothetical protein PFY12_02290 [Chryseobacterium camelliae]
MKNTLKLSVAVFGLFVATQAKAQILNGNVGGTVSSNVNTGKIISDAKNGTAATTGKVNDVVNKTKTSAEDATNKAKSTLKSGKEQNSATVRTESSVNTQASSNGTAGVEINTNSDATIQNGNSSGNSPSVKEQAQNASSKAGKKISTTKDHTETKIKKVSEKAKNITPSGQLNTQVSGQTHVGH